MSKKKRLSHIDYVLKNSTKIQYENEKFSIKFKKCYLCGEFLNPYTTNIDHIIPKSKGGMYNKSNIVTVHTRCNYEKSDNEMIEIDKVLGIDISCFYKQKNKRAKLLLRKLVPSFTNCAIIDLKDIDKIKSLLNLYKIDYIEPDLNDKTKVGYVPKDVVCKVHIDYTFNTNEMFILRTHLKNKIIHKVCLN